jgi:hypothetical protein
VAIEKVTRTSKLESRSENGEAEPWPYAFVKRLADNMEYLFEGVSLPDSSNSADHKSEGSEQHPEISADDRNQGAWKHEA